MSSIYLNGFNGSVPYPRTVSGVGVANPGEIDDGSD